MKKRILSTVLAVLLLLSTLTVGAFAADQVNNDDSPAKVTLTVGNASAAAGGVALVPIYAYAEGLGTSDAILRQWQFKFSGAIIESGESTEHKFVVTEGSSQKFTNVGENKAGCTAESGKGIVTNAALTAFGGVQIATLAFSVPDKTTGTISVSIAEVEVFAFDDTDLGTHRVKAENITTVAGSITVLAKAPTTGKADAVVGEGGDFVIPGTNAAGQTVTAIAQENPFGDSPITGTFSSLYIPSTITSIDANVIEATVGKIILKNANYSETVMENIQKIITYKTSGGLYPNKEMVVYYHKMANGTGTTYSAISKWNAAYYCSSNILAAPSIEVATTGDTRTMTVVGKIAVDDLVYGGLTIEVKLADGKVIRNATPGTVVGKNVNGATAEGGVYYYAISITGIPADVELDGATAVMYGTTPDATGNMITVVSDTATYNA